MTQTSGQTAAWYQTAHVGAVAEVSKATCMPYTRTDLLTQCYYSGRAYKLIASRARLFVLLGAHGRKDSCSRDYVHRKYVIKKQMVTTTRLYVISN